MQTGNLFVEFLRKLVHLVGVLAGVSVGPEFNLSEGLVSERVRHDERRVTSSTSQVQETSLSQHDDSVSIREFESFDLRLNFVLLDVRPAAQAVVVDFVIEVTDVTNDSVVLHLGHMFSHDDVLVTSGGNEDISLLDDAFQTDNLESLHASLKSADGIDFSNVDTSTASDHSFSATFTDITESADDDLLTSNHNVGGSENTIRKRVSASIDIVELGFSNGVVNVDSGERKFTLLSDLVESMNTSGGFFRNTCQTSDDISPSGGIFGDGSAENGV